jgi:ABC-type enterobactin transport system permease subunit
MRQWVAICAYIVILCAYIVILCTRILILGVGIVYLCAQICSLRAYIEKRNALYTLRGLSAEGRGSLNRGTFAWVLISLAMLVSPLVALQGIAGIPEPLTAKRADVKHRSDVFRNILLTQSIN